MNPIDLRDSEYLIEYGQLHRQSRIISDVIFRYLFTPLE